MPLSRLTRCLHLPSLSRSPRYPHVLHRVWTAPSTRTSRQFTASALRQRPTYVRFGEGPGRPAGPTGGGEGSPRWGWRAQILVAVVGIGGVYYVTHLERVPETGRLRFMDINPQYEAKLAKVAHDELMAKFRGKILPSNHPLTRHVRRVVNSILEANTLGTLEPDAPGPVSPPSVVDEIWAPDTRAQDEVPPGIGGTKWHLLVVNDDKIVNAMASYGNIVVFTGILPIAKDEHGLAAILGHEIGHVVARHPSEGYSSLKIALGLVALLQVIGLDYWLSQTVINLLYNLPNSRNQEFEADQIGLRLSAKACFEPRAVLEVFVRLGKLEKAIGGPNFGFIQTHPTSDKRVQRLETLLPQAYQIQAANPQCGNLQDSMSAFTDTLSRGFGKGLGLDDTSSWRW